MPRVSGLAVVKYKAQGRTLAGYSHEDNAILLRNVTRSQVLDKFDIVSVSTCANVMNQAFRSCQLTNVQ